MSVADRQLAFWLFLLTFVAYAYFQAGGGWNQNSQFDLTRAIVEHHTFAIDAYASNTGDVSRAGGHVYSNKSPALSWIAARASVDARKTSNDSPKSRVQAAPHKTIARRLTAVNCVK